MTRLRGLAGGVALAGLLGAGGLVGVAHAGYPKTIEHEFGEIRLAEKPEVIVSLEPAAVTDSLIALGFPPALSATYGLAGGDDPDVWPPAIREQAMAAGIRSVGTTAEPNLEAIAVVQPDLIIAYPWQAATLYRQLSLIAPTLVVPFVRDFRPPMQLIAEALDATAEADALIEELRHLQQAIRQAHGGTEIGIVRPRQFAAWLYGPGSNAGRLLVEAGLEIEVPVEDSSVTPDSPSAIYDLSLERVPGIEAEFLFFILYNLEEPLDRYLQHPVWQRADAVAEDAVQGVQGIAWTNHGPLGALEMLREVKQALDARSGAAD
ncbi:ABC transporter substrate-binding protein [Marinobacter sp. NSM]|uniref:ABC transporter substrate-binding protein n=1 Tax=Marinobacter sp. NSM TaxID=3458004 RepID=UPI004036EA6D